ncbi:hypothetical protein, partial [uncultured Desulfovibrio sp.]|uniref:hypothetical protein n=1 Tax=uncultured Desulfovibrio sp. TaxID=167968 RepID=UPI002804553F
MDAVLCRGETAQEEGFTNVAAAPWAAKSAVSFVLRGELPFVQGCCPASGLVRLRGDRPNGGPQGACLLRRGKLRASRAGMAAEAEGSNAGVFLSIQQDRIKRAGEGEGS